jgi:hypothetical protein
VSIKRDFFVAANKHCPLEIKSDNKYVLNIIMFDFMPHVSCTYTPLYISHAAHRRGNFNIDVGSTPIISFCLDERKHPDVKLGGLGENMRELQGPALLCFDNAVSMCDVTHYCCLHKSNNNNNNNNRFWVFDCLYDHKYVNNI